MPPSGARTSRRLRLVWNDLQSEHHPNDGMVSERREVQDSHDGESCSDNWQMQRERREVHAASQFVRTVASRVGFVDESGTVPRQLRHQQWSPFNVRRLSHVAVVGSTSRTSATHVGGWSRKFRTCNSADWLGSVAQHRAVVGGITSREPLAEWIHNQGFRRHRWGAHFSGRAQERILNGAVAMDARGAGLEVAHVNVVLDACRQEPKAAEENQFPIGLLWRSCSGNFWTK